MREITASQRNSRNEQDGPSTVPFASVPPSNKLIFSMMLNMLGDLAKQHDPRLPAGTKQEAMQNFKTSFGLVSAMIEAETK